ncbi:hypothetical protein [Escherichia phage SECphi4]|nr:hypothetical protein [Escherichia phage SECphi4]
MTPMQIALMAGFSQKFISVDACIDDYEYNGVATVCDGDTKTIEEIEETEL